MALSLNEIDLSASILWNSLWERRESSPAYIMNLSIHYVMIKKFGKSITSKSKRFN